MSRLQGLIPTILVGVMGNSVIYLIPLLVGAMVTDRGFSEAQAGFIASADLAGYAVTTFLTALVLHRLSWRLAALVAVALLCVANIVTTFVFDPTLFAVIRFISGAGGGILAAIATVSVGQTDKPDRNFGILFAAALLFATVGLWALPTLFERYGLNGGYYLVAALALLVGTVTGRLPEDRAGQENAVAAPIRPDWFLSGLVLAAITVFWTEQNAIYAYLERMGAGAGLSAQYVGFSLGIMNLTGAVGAALVAWIGTRFGRAIPLVVVTVVKVACLAVLAGRLTATSYLLAASILALAWNVMNPFQFGILAHVDKSGKALAMASTVTGAGLALGPAAGALAMGHGQGYVPILWLAGALALISLWLSLAPLRSSSRRATAAAAITSNTGKASC